MMNGLIRHIDNESPCLKHKSSMCSFPDRLVWLVAVITPLTELHAFNVHFVAVPDMAYLHF